MYVYIFTLKLLNTKKEISYSPEVSIGWAKKVDPWVIELGSAHDSLFKKF
jgi:hypothetical protein